MTTLQQLDYLHTDDNLQELSSQEMRSALETFGSRKKVREDLQEFVAADENQELRNDLKKLAGNEIKKIKSDENLRTRLLSMQRSEDGSKRGKQRLTGEFEGQKITPQDRACYGVLCLYDQMVGSTDNTSGRGYFADAQYRLQNFNDTEQTVENISQDSPTNTPPHQDPTLETKQPDIPIQPGNSDILAPNGGENNVPEVPVTPNQPEDLVPPVTPTIPDTPDTQPNVPENKDDNTTIPSKQPDIPIQSGNSDIPAPNAGQNNPPEVPVTPNTPEDLVPPVTPTIPDTPDTQPNVPENKDDNTTIPSKQLNIPIQPGNSDIPAPNAGQNNPPEVPVTPNQPENLVPPVVPTIPDTPDTQPNVPENENIGTEETDIPADIETLTNVAVRGGPRPEYSTNTTSCYEVNSPSGATNIGRLQLFGGESKTDLITAATYGEKLFDYDEQSQSRFPNIQKIQDFFKTSGAEVQIVMAGPMYENQVETTGFSIDNGKITGSDLDINGPKTKGKAILLIKDGKIQMTHTDEIANRSEQEKEAKITKGEYDIMAVPSLKRNGKLNNNPTLRNYTHGHYMVEFKNGRQGMLMLNSVLPEEKKKILSSPDIVRAVYLDTAGDKGQLDGYWLNKQNTLTYSHNSNGDIQWGEESPAQVRGNMPAIMVVYKGSSPEWTPPNSDTPPPTEKPQETNKTIDDIDTDKVLTPGITLDALKNSVQKIKDPSLQQYVQEQLILGNVVHALQALGMKRGSIYRDNNINATGTIDALALKNIEKRKNRVYRNYEQIMSEHALLDEFGNAGEMPSDVKKSYLNFAYNDLAKQYGSIFTSKVEKPSRVIDHKDKNYVIVSKTDAHVYLFDKDHHLVSRKACLLGQDRSNTFFDIADYNNTKKIPKRTPAGLYMIEVTEPVKDLGQYMQFTPLDNQIKYRRFKQGTDHAGQLVRSIGFHEVYHPEAVERNKAIRARDDINAKFMTNGCINIDTKSYSELHDHLPQGGLVYVTE